jgi:ankyrin repeat protein
MREAFYFKMFFFMPINLRGLFSMQMTNKKCGGITRKTAAVKRRFIVFGIFCFSFLFFPALDVFSGGTKQINEVAELSPFDKVAELIRAGKTEEVRTAFVSLNDPNAVDGQGRNAVHIAASVRSSELADFFIRLGANADAEDSAGHTPLNISADLLDSGTAQVLVKNGAFIHHFTPSEQSPAVKAIVSANDVFLRSLITPESLLSTDGDGKTMLHLAAEAGNAAAITSILGAVEAGGDQQFVNKLDRSGRTALDYAFMQRNSQAHSVAAEILIQADGFSSDPFFLYFAPLVQTMNFNLRASDGNSALHYAVKEKYRGFTYFLLDHRADPNIKNIAGVTPLHEAASIGDLAVMKALLEHGAEVNIQDGQGNTVMHIAMPADTHKAALDLLFRYKANPNLRDLRGDSPLHIIIKLNRGPEIVETLLKNGADVSIHNSEGKTPLYIAVEENRTSLLPLFLDYHADIFAAANGGKTPFGLAMSGNRETLNLLITGETVLQSDNNGNTPLIAAVAANVDVEVIQRILDKNALINARNLEGDNALHIAVRQNEAAVGTLLITRGADVFAQNVKGESPVYLTLYSPHSQNGILEWMLTPIVLAAKDGLGNTILHYATQWKLDSAIAVIAAKGASLEAANVTGETPLFIAVKIDSASTVKALLIAGASIASRDALGNTALHTAVRWNAPAAANALAAAGIDVNAYNLYGKTPLHDAVRLGVFGMENLLIDLKANLEARDKDGNTPLMEAVLKGSFRSAEHLLNSGASVSTRNNGGDTPLLVAVEEERSDMVGILLDKGAQIHAKNADGESPLTAALKTSLRMTLSLLEKGREQTDDEGRTPLHIALSYNMSEADIEMIAGWLVKTNAVDRAGKTALRYAVDQGSWDAAKFLANGGSDVFSVARDGKTPVEITLNTVNHEAVRAVFGGNAINAHDPEGNTVLHYAARVSPASIVSLLIELGADKSILNTSGDSPLDIAQRWNRNDIAAILR